MTDSAKIAESIQTPDGLKGRFQTELFWRGVYAMRDAAALQERTAAEPVAWRVMEPGMVGMTEKLYWHREHYGPDGPPFGLRGHAPRPLYAAVRPSAVDADGESCTGHAEADRIISRLNSSDPDFDDCADAAALIYKLVAENKGPEGFATWKDAAIAERMKRLVAIQPEPPHPFRDTTYDGYKQDICADCGETGEAGHHERKPVSKGDDALGQLIHTALYMARLDGKEGPYSPITLRAIKDICAHVATLTAEPGMSVPRERIALNVRHPDCHKAADAFWNHWRENGETHKHGYYESTWGAINAALRTVGVVEHDYAPPVALSPAQPDAPVQESER